MDTYLGNMGSQHELKLGAERLNPSWLLKVRPGLSLPEGTRQGLTKPKLEPKSLDFGSVGPLSEVPETKYQRILVLICYLRQPASGDQKAFVT